MNASVLGLGAWFPETVRTNDAWPAGFGGPSAGETRELTDVGPTHDGDACDRITARYFAAEHGDPFLGAVRRRVADDSLTAVEAEARAGRAALEDAGVDARDVGLVLSWAVVPDRVGPSGAPRVAYLLGAEGALATGVDAACASAITQLALAAAMVESGRVRYALLTQSHLMTRAFPLSHPASPNVGDAATALVVGRTTGRGILAAHAVSEGEHYDAVAWRRPRGNDTRWFEAGGATYLGSYAPEAARALILGTVRIATQTVREAAAQADVPLESIQVLAAVQPRRWIPPAIAEALHLDVAIAPSTFDEYAHLGGCGVVANLLAARRAGRLSRGAVLALYAQGAGFTRGAAVLKWH